MIYQPTDINATFYGIYWGDNSKMIIDYFSVCYTTWNTICRRWDMTLALFPPPSNAQEIITKIESIL